MGSRWGAPSSKDYAAGFICLYHFLACHGPTVRVVTTSVDDTQLDVLWGEIGRYINTCKYPLRVQDGGPLIVNDRHIRKVVCGVRDEISYILGRVAKTPEGMAGHHADHTLAVVDEASGVDDTIFAELDKWGKRKLIFGNPMRPQGYFYQIAKKYEAGSIQV